MISQVSFHAYLRHLAWPVKRQYEVTFCQFGPVTNKVIKADIDFAHLKATYSIKS